MRLMPFFTLSVSLLAQAPPDPLSLREALDLAAKQNPAVLAARIRAAEAQDQAAVVQSALKPQLNGVLQSAYQVSNLQGIGLNFPGLNERIGPYSTFNVRPQFSQTVFDASLIASARAAKARVVQSGEDAASAREQTLAAVVQFYLQAQQADSQSRAAKARVDTAEAVLQQVRDTVSAGTANKLDLARAEQQLERERTALIVANRNRDALTTLLVRTLGFQAGGAIDLAPLPPLSDPTVTLQEALQTRPEMKSLLARRKVLELELQRASRERWPKFNVTADAGAFGSTPADATTTYVVAGTVTIPIYTGGRIENEIKAARLRLDQWEQDRRQLENSIAQEIAQANIERKAAEQAVQSSARAASAAREALELSRLRYRAGLNTNLDVVTAQSNLAQSEEEEIRNRYDALLARARLAQARGDVSSLLKAN
jgi:outer membrane protein